MLLNFSIIFLRYSHATDSNWPEIEGESTTSGSNSPYGQSNSNKSKRIDAANATRKKKQISMKYTRFYLLFNHGHLQAIILFQVPFLEMI